MDNYLAHESEYKIRRHFDIPEIERQENNFSKLVLLGPYYFR